MSNLKVYAKTIEDEALEQINTLLSQDAFKDCKVRIMPDVHAGKGCVIGFTADLGNKVIPNIVGVDIGCGMLCVSLGHRDFNAVTLNTLDRVIRTYVPSGKNVHDGRQMRFEELKELYCYRELKDTKRLERSIGTLGGGNHFIEVDVAEDGYKYLIIHTGSRNLGKQVADYYQNLLLPPEALRIPSLTSTHFQEGIYRILNSRSFRPHETEDRIFFYPQPNRQYSKWHTLFLDCYHIFQRFPANYH